MGVQIDYLFKSINIVEYKAIKGAHSAPLIVKTKNQKCSSSSPKHSLIKCLQDLMYEFRTFIVENVQ